MVKWESFGRDTVGKMVWSNNETGLVDELNKLAIFADNPLVVEGKSYAAFDAISDKYVCEFK